MAAAGDFSAVPAGDDSLLPNSRLARSLPDILIELWGGSPMTPC